jgi:hypothetical protein
MRPSHDRGRHRAGISRRFPTGKILSESFSEYNYRAEMSVVLAGLANCTTTDFALTFPHRRRFEFLSRIRLGGNGFLFLFIRLSEMLWGDPIFTSRQKHKQY